MPLSSIMVTVTSTNLLDDITCGPWWVCFICRHGWGLDGFRHTEWNVACVRLHHGRVLFVRRCGVLRTGGGQDDGQEAN